jgi:hypothetical protein
VITRLYATRLSFLQPLSGWLRFGPGGPAAFGRHLRQDLMRAGLVDSAFHQERFDMR